MKNDILNFIDGDMRRQKIIQAVLDERGGFQHDVSLAPMFKVMAQRVDDQQPFWDLRCAVRWAARCLAADSYLEVGNRTGWSLLQAVRERPALQVIGFDLWLEDYASVSNSSPAQLKELLQRAGHKGNLQFVSGNSHVTLPAFIAGLQTAQFHDQSAFDIITVDGDHSLEGAREDLEVCAALVRPGGIIIFDDLIHEQHPYLRELWHEFGGAHREFVCVENVRDYPGTGIGFRLPMPSFLTEGMQGLPASYNTPVKTHTALPSFSLMAQHIGYLESRLEQTSIQGTELEAMRADRVAKEGVIARLVADLDAVRADQAAKEGMIARLVADLDTVRADQAAKEGVIARQQGMFTAKETVITELSSELSEYRSLGWGLASIAVKAKRRLSRSRARKPEAMPDSTLEAARREGAIRKSGTLHVALDLLQIQFGISGGVEVYMTMLARALMSQTERIRITLLCTPDQVPHLQTLFHDRVSYYTFHCEPAMSLVVGMQQHLQGGAKPAAAANVSFAHLAAELGVDVLHSPVQIFSRTDFTVPAVLNLHDLQHLHYPENFTAGDLETRNRLYGQSAAIASAVIASSDFVRQDIVTRMGILASKVHTIPVACSPDIEQGLQAFTTEQAQQAYHLPDTFGFYPAQFWPHKNHARLIEALAMVRQRAPQHDFKLVFTGFRGLSGWPSVERALDKHNMHDHVLLLDFVPTNHLGALYKLAIFCVMPSLFEASSYPVIEAQTLGRPAMCSNVTSLPELMADGAGLLFDPHSAEDMTDKMLRWLNDPEDRLAHAERGRQRALREHSLAVYTSKVLDIYSTIKKG